MDWLLRFADPSLDWSYALITLFMRFIGVFLVMLTMQAALLASARAVGYLERRDKRATPPAGTGAAERPASMDGFVEEAGPDDATAAAIGLALALEAPAAGLQSGEPTRSSAWTMAGRIAQLHRRPD
jgi:hypothetical protein